MSVRAMPQSRQLALCVVLTYISLSVCYESCKQPSETYRAEATEAVAAEADASTGRSRSSLWSLYYKGLQHAKYIDLSHVLKPAAPIWKGFGHPQQFQPAKDPATGKAYRYVRPVGSSNGAVELFLYWSTYQIV